MIKIGKPETPALDETVKRLALPTGSHLLGVGNTLGDMKAYRAAGMVTVFVNYGNRVKLSHILTLADYFAETPEELLDILQRVAAKPVPDFPEIDDSDLPF